MPYNGSGVFAVFTPGTPYVTGTVISSSVANSVNSDFATGLSTAVTKDGQTAITANLPMSGFKHTNVAVASAQTDYLRASQAQDGSITYLTSVSGTNTITANAGIAMIAYATGQRFSFLAAGVNTDAVTLNINSIGAKAVTRNGVALDNGDIAAGSVVEVLYDGTDFELLGAGVAINSLVEDTTPDVNSDFVVTYDASANVNKKTLLGNAGALRHIETIEASEDANITFDSGFSNAYTSYLFILELIRPSLNNDDLYMLLSDDGGATFEPSGYRWVSSNSVAPSTGAVTGDDSDAKIILAGNISNSISFGVSGVIELISTYLTDAEVNFKTQYVKATGPTAQNSGSGRISLAAAANAVRFVMASGNIFSARVSMYGLGSIV